MFQTRRHSPLKVEDLGSFTANGKRFVVNLRPGVPRNACIERSGESLQCWASKTTLSKAAEDFIRENATPTDNNAFVWNEGVRVRETPKR